MKGNIKSSLFLHFSNRKSFINCHKILKLFLFRTGGFNFINKLLQQIKFLKVNIKSCQKFYGFQNIKNLLVIKSFIKFRKIWKLLLFRTESFNCILTKLSKCLIKAQAKALNDFNAGCLFKVQNKLNCVFQITYSKYKVLKKAREYKYYLYDFDKNLKKGINKAL